MGKTRLTEAKEAKTGDLDVVFYRKTSFLVEILKTLSLRKNCHEKNGIIFINYSISTVKVGPDFMQALINPTPKEVILKTLLP